MVEVYRREVLAWRRDSARRQYERYLRTATIKPLSPRWISRVGGEPSKAAPTHPPIPFPPNDLNGQARDGDVRHGIRPRAYENLKKHCWIIDLCASGSLQQRLAPLALAQRGTDAS